MQQDDVPQLFLKHVENDLTAPTQPLPFLTNTNASITSTTSNQNKYNNYYFNQTEKEDSNGRCWLLPSSPNSDFVSSPEKNISSPETTDSNISIDFHQVFGNNQNSFELMEKNEIPLEDWELTRLTVRELNQKLAGQDRSIVSALKQKRRTLKNRGYALNCRARRLKNQQQLEEENARLKIVINQQAALLAEYERKLGRSKEAQSQLIENRNSLRGENMTFEYHQQKQHNYHQNSINNSLFSNQQQTFKDLQCSSYLHHSSFASPLESEEHNSIPIDFQQQMSSSLNMNNNNLDLGQNFWNSFQ